MEIDRKYALNKKKLTKKEVQEILAKGPRLDLELSKPFWWTWANGYTQKNSLYELPDNKYLFVFDSKDASTPNRGEIFSTQIVHRWVKHIIRLEEDAAAGLSSSFQYWRHFSKNGISLINKSAELKKELAERLFIAEASLDYSYESLDLITRSLENTEIKFIRENYMDNLVNYVGEVLIKRVKGHWDITEKNILFDEVPFVSIEVKNVAYNPVNVVYTCLTSVDGINLRKEAANEVRSQTSRLSFERHFEGLKDK